MESLISNILQQVQLIFLVGYLQTSLSIKEPYFNYYLIFEDIIGLILLSIIGYLISKLSQEFNLIKTFLNYVLSSLIFLIITDMFQLVQIFKPGNSYEDLEKIKIQGLLLLTILSIFKTVWEIFYVNLKKYEEKKN